MRSPRPQRAGGKSVCWIAGEAANDLRSDNLAPARLSSGEPRAPAAFRTGFANFSTIWQAHLEEEPCHQAFSFCGKTSLSRIAARGWKTPCGGRPRLPQSRKNYKTGPESCTESSRLLTWRPLRSPTPLQAARRLRPSARRRRSLQPLGSSQVVRALRPSTRRRSCGHRNRQIAAGPGTHCDRRLIADRARTAADEPVVGIPRPAPRRRPRGRRAY